MITLEWNKSEVVPLRKVAQQSACVAEGNVDMFQKLDLERDIPIRGEISSGRELPWRGSRS